MQLHEVLEARLIEWTGMPHVVACSSGTAALHLALEALGLPAGSEVLVPDYTMVACPRAVALAGLTPVFVGCGPNLLMDLGSLYDAVKAPDLSAIMTVHVYGRTVDGDHVETAAVAGPRPLAIIEDMAELHGVRPHPATDAACWSFYRNKIVAGEEGGCVGFRSAAHAAKARRLRSLGFTDAHDYMHEPRGHNYRLADSLAGQVAWSLHRFDDNYRKRRVLERAYDDGCPREWRMPARQSPWVYDVRIPGLTREGQAAVVKGLNGMGVAARQGFKPMSWQPEFKGCRVVGTGEAARAAYEVLYMPLDPGLGVTQAVRAMTALIGLVARHR